MTQGKIEEVKEKGEVIQETVEKKERQHISVRILLMPS